MKTSTLVSTVFLAISLLLSACSDRSLIKDNNPNSNPRETEQGSLGRVHVNDLGEKYWVNDPNKKHSLYVVVLDRINDCKGVLQLENQLGELECEARKVERMEYAELPKDYSREDIKDMFGVDREPVEGVTRISTHQVEIQNSGGPNGPKGKTKATPVVNWYYSCNTAENEEAFAKKSNLTVCKN